LFGGRRGDVQRERVPTLLDGLLGEDPEAASEIEQPGAGQTAGGGEGEESEGS
jgi:hypothetical protein